VETDLEDFAMICARPT